MKETVWMLQDAKNKFCQLIDSVDGSPQIITKRGEAVAVVVSYKDYCDQFADQESFLDFMNRSPLRGSGLQLDARTVDPPTREVEL